MSQRAFFVLLVMAVSAVLGAASGQVSQQRDIADPGRIDIRQFGAVPDGRTPADDAVASAIAYAETVHGCVYIPDTSEGFLFRSSIKIRIDTCLIGSRIRGYPPSGNSIPVYPSVSMHFVNDSSGIEGPGKGVGPYNCYIANLSLVGNAGQSRVATHTAGLDLTGMVDCKIENIFIADFVVCRRMTGPASRMIIRDIWCNDQQVYPNPINDFPYACVEITAGPRLAVGGVIADGDLCREQSWTSRTLASGNGAATSFDISMNKAGIPLWRADGIKVRIGSRTDLPNGQVEFEAPLVKCGMGPGDGAYTLWDISAGGSGSGGRQLFCTHTSAVVTSGNPQITVGSTRSYRAGENILAVADHGLPLADRVKSIDDATHLTLTKPPDVTGRLDITLTEDNVAGGGGGREIQVRFTTPPPRGKDNIDIDWIDPTGYAGYDINGGSDYLTFRPLMVGGYDVAVKHTGRSYGGVTFEPTYIELLNQCADIERATYGDVVIFHRIVNPPIPDCPGYVAPDAGPTIAAFNNVYHYYNGASNGGPAPSPLPPRH